MGDSKIIRNNIITAHYDDISLLQKIILLNFMKPGKEGRVLLDAMFTIYTSTIGSNFERGLSLIELEKAADNDNFIYEQPDIPLRMAPEPSHIYS